MIPGRMSAVSQNGVVKKVREHSEGPVQNGSCRALNARISQEQHLVIKRESGRERI